MEDDRKPYNKTPKEEPPSPRVSLGFLIAVCTSLLLRECYWQKQAAFREEQRVQEALRRSTR